MQQIIIQNNGKLAVWDPLFKEFYIMDGDIPLVVDYFLNRQRAAVETNVRNIVGNLKEGLKPYGKHTMEFGDALEQYKKAHGIANLERLLTGLAGETKPTEGGD